MGRRFKLGENEKEIIKVIGLGLLVVASLALPNLPLAINSIQKVRGNKGLRKLLKQLKKKNVIYLGGEKIKLTAKGRKLLDEIYLSEFKIVKSEKWDKKWRLVSYDIPEIYKKSRNLFRKVLENNDFYQVHKSLWVSPYDCKEEIAVFAKNLGLSKYVIVMTTDKLPNQKEMIEYFGLKEN